MDSILRPVLRPVLQPVLRSVFGASGGGTPSLTAQVQALFAKYSAAGGMWDFTDMGTLFQDSAGITPVMVSGQAVGRVSDLSGHGYNLTQAVAGNRPLFDAATGGVFDGVNDAMSAAIPNGTYTVGSVFGATPPTVTTGVSISGEYTLTQSTTRRIVIGAALTPDDLAVVAAWLAEAMATRQTFNVTDNGGEPFGVTEGDFLVEA